MRLISLVKKGRWMLLFPIIVFSITDANGQGFQTAASWNLVEYGNRISALGQSTAVLNNRVAFHPNPAIPAENGVITFSSYLISSEPVQTLLPDDPVMYNPAVSYGARKWSFSAKTDYTRWGSDVELRDEANNLLGERRASFDTRILRLNISRELFTRLYLGLGISHLKDYYPTLAHTELSPNNDNSASEFMFSAGLYYSDLYPVSWMLLRPQFGIAVTDIGGALNYNLGSHWMQDNLSKTTPGQLRSNFGLDIVTQKIIANQRFAQIGLYFSLNKYMSGLLKSDWDEGFYTGLEMVTSTWGSFERSDGTGVTTYTLSDQISTSYGIELGLLETIFFQFGSIDGAEMWIRPHSTFGVTLDFQYVSLSYNRIKYHQSDGWYFDEWSTSGMNIDIRIPVDGSFQPTILNQIRDWLSD